MKPSWRNLFMKKLTRERVVPIISASSLLADRRDDRLGLPLLAEIRKQQKQPRQAFSLELKS